MPAIDVRNVSKRFTLHQQEGMTLPVLERVSFAVGPGECVVLDGPSGAGKSTLMRCIYGNYRTDKGAIVVRHGYTEIDVASAPPRAILAVRRETMAYVSQFLRVIPRVSAVDVVSEPLLTRGVERDVARERAKALLERLSIPKRLWSLPPATFSGGEQQRVNIARGFIADAPVLLLDEPTAALDAANRNTVVELIRQATQRGAAVIGIFHDAQVRDAVATRCVALKRAA